MRGRDRDRRQIGRRQRGGRRDNGGRAMRNGGGDRWNRGERRQPMKKWRYEDSRRSSFNGPNRQNFAKPRRGRGQDRRFIKKKEPLTSDKLDNDLDNYFKAQHKGTDYKDYLDNDLENYRKASQQEKQDPK